MPAPTESNRGIILRRFERLLEYTRDAERFEFDKNFARRGGSITYVFDENIFEQFISPKEMYHYTDFFHASIWANPKLKQSDMRSISAQHAMVSAEYLFRGDLPGQTLSKIYMTEWHFEELLNRRGERIKNLKLEISQEPPGRLRHHDIPKNELALVDAASFAHSVGRTSHVMRSFEQVSSVSRWLVEDNWLSQLTTLKRLGSKDFINRLTPLGIKYRPNEQDRINIRSERDKWLSRLRRERDGRGDSSDRSDISLKNDAAAMAYMLWITHNQLDNKEKLLFVTGDALLFDTYRSWFLKQDEGEPFILRRPAQYMSLIAISSDDGQIKKSPQIADAIRRTVEPALFVFNLAQTPTTNEFHSGREYLASELAKYNSRRSSPAMGFFANDLTETWLEERQRDFEVLISQWQHVERLMIVAEPLLIMRRYALQRKEGIDERVASQDGQNYTSYVTRQLDELSQGSIRLFFPFATDFMRRSSVLDRFLDPGRIPRVPISLQVAVPGLGTHYEGANEEGIWDLLDLLRRWRAGDEGAETFLDTAKNQELARRSDVVFAIAAVIALEAAEWRDGERFSALARSALGANRVAEDEAIKNNLEYAYMEAVSKRFRMGSLLPSPTGSRSNVWRRFLDESLTNLQMCEEEHLRAKQMRRCLRAVSERAATRIFYATWGLVTPIETLAICQLSHSDVFEQLRLARDDLRKCLELGEHVLDQHTSDPFYLRIRRQYYTNLASIQAMYGLQLWSIGSVVFEGLSAEEVDKISLWIGQLNPNEVSRSWHSAGQTALLAFRAFQFADAGASQTLKFSGRRERAKGELIRDHALAAAYASALESETWA